MGGATAFRISVRVDKPTRLKSWPNEVDQHVSIVHIRKTLTELVQLRTLRILKHIPSPFLSQLVLGELLDLLIDRRLGLLDCSRGTGPYRAPNPIHLL